jgi:hypothetical protein
MTYFEYKLLAVDALVDLQGRWTVEKLNKLGEETWQLVGQVEDRLIFMRQVGR